MHARQRVLQPNLGGADGYEMRPGRIHLERPPGGVSRWKLARTGKRPLHKRIAHPRIGLRDAANQHRVPARNPLTALEIGSRAAPIGRRRFRDRTKTSTAEIENAE